MTADYVRSEASKTFESFLRPFLPAQGLPTSNQIDQIDFGTLEAYLLKGKFMRPSGPRGVGARMDVDYAGAGIAQRLNVDLTGFEYFRRLLPDEKALIVGVFEDLFDHECGRWRVMFYRFDKGLKLAVDTTFFPYICSESGTELVCALIVPAEAPLLTGSTGRAYSAEAGPAAEWIDLGSGVPECQMLELETD